MIAHSDLPYCHKEDCKSKDSSKILKKNIQMYKEDEVEYDVYCKECGTFFYNFCWGHKEY